MIASNAIKIRNFISDKKFNEVLRGSAWGLFAKIIATVLNLVITIFIARKFGAEAVGILAVIHSYIMFSGIFAELGTKTSVLRLIPEHLAKYSATSAYKIYKNIQYLVSGTSLLVGGVLFLTAKFIAAEIFSKPKWFPYFAIAALFLIFKSLMALNAQTIRGLRLIRTYAFLNVLPYLSMLIILFLIASSSRDKGGPVYAQLIAWAVSAVVAISILNKAFKKRMLPQDAVQNMTIVEILTISLPMLMTASLQFFISQTGVILLGMLTTDTSVGYYSIAVKLATLTVFFLQAVNWMAAPKFSELYYSGKIDDLFYVAQKSSKIIFFSSAPILLCLLLFGKLILVKFFGIEFVAAYPSMVILVVGQFINAISGSTAFFMNMTGLHKLFRNIIFFTAIINISANFLLIPHFGILGAAIAAMISTSLWNILALLFIRIKYGQSTGYLPFIENIMRKKS